MMKRIKAVTASKQADAQTATLAQQAMRPPDLPDPENANIMDRIKLNAEEAMKRKGRASTLMGGAKAAPKTAVKTLMPGSY